LNAFRKTIDVAKSTDHMNSWLTVAGMIVVSAQPLNASDMTRIFDRYDYLLKHFSMPTQRHARGEIHGVGLSLAIE
jgi:hypothetical protein